MTPATGCASGFDALAPASALTDLAHQQSTSGQQASRDGPRCDPPTLARHNTSHAVYLQQLAEHDTAQTEHLTYVRAEQSISGIILLIVPLLLLADFFAIKLKLRSVLEAAGSEQTDEPSSGPPVLPKSLMVVDTPQATPMAAGASLVVKLDLVPPVASPDSSQLSTSSASAPAVAPVPVAPVKPAAPAPSAASGSDTPKKPVVPLQTKKRQPAAFWRFSPIELPKLHDPRIVMLGGVQLLLGAGLFTLCMRSHLPICHQIPLQLCSLFSFAVGLSSIFWLDIDADALSRHAESQKYWDGIIARLPGWMQRAVAALGVHGEYYHSGQLMRKLVEVVVQFASFLTMATTTDSWYLMVFLTAQSLHLIVTPFVLILAPLAFRRDVLLGFDVVCASLSRR